MQEEYYHEDDVVYEDDQEQYNHMHETPKQQSSNHQIESLNASDIVKQKLIQAGYRSLDDLKTQSALALSKECGISQKDALSMIRQAKGGPPLNNTNGTPQKTINNNDNKTNNNNNQNTSSRSSLTQSSSIKTQSALDAFHHHKERTMITTLCEEVDQVLGGGIPVGQTTEICGVPGVGKTQLALQLAVNVQLPLSVGGCEGHCLFIDTEGSFMIERVEQIAQSLVTSVKAMITDNKTTISEEKLQSITAESLLNGIRYFRVYNLIEQLAFVQILDQYLGNDPSIKLIIVDTITFHFRHDQQGFGDYFQRNRLLQGICQKLSQIANEKDISVVYLNQVTTKIEKSVISSGSHLAPAMSPTITNSCNNQIFLEFERGERYLRVNKGLKPSTVKPKANFTITPDGFRGKSNPSADHPSPFSTPVGKKRPREEE